jgi:hypothetical protein
MQKGYASEGKKRNGNTESIVGFHGFRVAVRVGYFYI